MVQFGEDLVSKDWRRRYQLMQETKSSRNLCRSSGSNESNSVYLAKSGGVRGHSWIRQALSDAWEPMNLEEWLGDPGHMMTGSHLTNTETKLASHQQMMNPELKLTKKVTADEEGT